MFLKHVRRLKPNFVEIMGYDKDYLGVLTKPENIADYEFMENILKKELKTMMQQQEALEDMSSLKLKARESKIASKVQKQELIIIATMICANLRSLRYHSSLAVALEMLANFSVFFSDNIKLHVIVPYLFTLIEEQTPQVVVLAFSTAMDILRSIKRPIRYFSDTKLFEDYIKPNLSKVFQLHEVQIGSAFAERLYQMIDLGVLFTTESIIFKASHKKKEEEEEEAKEGDANKAQPAEDLDLDDEDENINPNRVIDPKTQELIDKETDKVKEELAKYIQDIASCESTEIREVFLRSLPKLARALGPLKTE